MTSDRPSPSQLLETPGAMLLRTDLRELGLQRRAVDVVFEKCENINVPGYARPMIRATDYLALLAGNTYRDDRVYPSRAKA